MKTKVFKFSQKNKFENPFYGGKKMSKKVIGKPFFIINYLNNGNHHMILICNGLKHSFSYSK